MTKVLYKGKASNRGFKMPLVMLHYSRTLEKYELKSKTWKTSSGEQTKADRYQIGGFSDRQLGESCCCSVSGGGSKFLNVFIYYLGVHYDPRASQRYGCQLREHLAAMTGEEVFYRPGDFWLRNVAYGKGG